MNIENTEEIISKKDKAISSAIHILQHHLKELSRPASQSIDIQTASEREQVAKELFADLKNLDAEKNKEIQAAFALIYAGISQLNQHREALHNNQQALLSVIEKAIIKISEDD